MESNRLKGDFITNEKEKLQCYDNGSVFPSEGYGKELFL
jgi:hypothetical protein